MRVMVVAEGGSLLKVPPIYMEKIAIGPTASPKAWSTSTLHRPTI